MTDMPWAQDFYWITGASLLFVLVYRILATKKSAHAPAARPAAVPATAATVVQPAVPSSILSAIPATASNTRPACACDSPPGCPPAGKPAANPGSNPAVRPPASPAFQAIIASPARKWTQKTARRRHSTNVLPPESASYG